MVPHGIGLVPRGRLQNVESHFTVVLQSSCCLDGFNEIVDCHGIPLKIVYHVEQLPSIILSDKALIKSIASSMMEIGKILLVEPYIKSVFKFSFISEMTTSNVREYLTDMPFENYPQGSIYTEQIGDSTMTVEVTKERTKVTLYIH